MRFAIVIYCFFLALEAGLAWVISGNAFLAAAVTCGMLFYASVWKLGGPWGEIVRALAAGLIAVAGPLYYRAAPLPTVLCFLTLPHLLAATQCFWEISLGKDPAPQNVRMRTVVFTVAFYAAMGLVFVLLRGAEPNVSVWITTPLAILVLIAALPAWDLARVTRLKPARAKHAAPSGVVIRRILLVCLVLGMIAALFSGVLPAAAEKLCAISPRWRAKVDTPEKPAPHPPQPPAANDGEANRPGMDSSALTGRHELPQKSNIQASGAVQLHLRPHDRSIAGQMVAGPVYVRSHAFDAWKDGAWESSVRGGQWLTDKTDGSGDGLIMLTKKAPPAVVAHTVFLNNADGSSLPALQGVTAWKLPAVYSLPGDRYQMQTAGNIRYDAVSAPVIWDLLPDSAALRTGNSGNPAHLLISESKLIQNIIFAEPSLRPESSGTLASQITGIRQWMAANVRYSNVMKGHPSLPPLDNFLAGERQGYCDFYASAGALMLRLYKVPTRVAYGFAGNDYNAETGVFTFTDETAHAWTEIFVEGYGWTVCDFTPPANIGGHNTPQEKEKQSFSEKDYEDQQQKGPEEPDTKKPEEFSLTAWWDSMVEKLLAMNPLELTKQGVMWLALAAVVLFSLRWLRRKKPKAGEDTFAADEKQPAYFAEFVRVFQAAGCVRAGGITPREYLAAVQRRGLAGPEFTPMIHYHYERRYRDSGRDRDQEADYLTLVRAAEQRLQQSQTRS